MNVAQANALSLPEILEKLGYNPDRAKGAELWYLSPFRQEKTPSFHVHTGKNVWFDFGTSDGGGVIDFMIAYLHSRNEAFTVRVALQVLGMMKSGISFVPLTTPVPPVHAQESNPALALRVLSTINNPLLKEYVARRGIPLAIARKYLKQLVIHNKVSGKNFYALGLANEEDGYEVRNMFFKGCIGRKGISVIRGRHAPAKEVHIFEGMFDYLTAVTYNKKNHFPGDCIVLNSTGLLPRVYPYLKASSYEAVYAWLDNDTAGNDAAAALEDFVRAETTMLFHSVNALYAGFKDVNVWHLSRLEKRPLPKPESPAAPA